MDKDQIKQTEVKIHDAEERLQQNSIKGAARILKEVADSLTDWDAITRLNGISESYKYLCHYFMSGTPDPQRHAMLQDMAEQLRQVADRLNRSLRHEDPGAYYAALRMSRLREYNIPELLKRYRALSSQISLADSAGNVSTNMLAEKYEILENLFTAILTSFQDKTAITQVLEAIVNPDMDDALRIQLASAVILSLTAWYDADKVRLLINIADNKSLPDTSRARAFTGLVFVLAMYGNRITRSGKLMDRLAALADNDDNIRHFRSAVKAVAGTLDTERISNKMKDEVIPEIMKLRPDIMNRMKGMSAEFDPESVENNPEWQEILDKSGITRKLEELAEMQSDGADVMMVTFSQLKKFPFFRSPNNWFLPFDSHNPELHLQERDADLLNAICRVSPSICDSDKYSLALAVAQTPENHRKAFMSQFESQFNQMSEEVREKLPDSSKPDFDREIIKSMRDFYRYFMLATNTGDYHNPFKSPMNFIDMPVIGEKLADNEFLLIMAEFYLKRGYHAEALRLFDIIAETSSTDAALWQKIGFCRQKMKDYAGARQAYMKSELLGDSSQWLIKKLAFVNKRLEEYTAAQEYYERALDNDNDNVKLLLNAAGNAVDNKDYQTALQHYYHADYLQPGSSNIRRSMAWVEMLAGNFDKSEQLYGELLADNPVSADWLNAGHVSLLRGDYATALDRYHQAAIPGKNDFAMAFNADIPTLQSLGASDDAIYILLDEVAG